MSTGHEDEDELQRAYREASGDAAGAPPPRLRKTILAEAAAAAGRRQPANDARYWLSAAAGIAVLGLGLVLWRQVPHQLPGDVPVMAEVSVDSTVKSAPAAEPVPAAPPSVAAEPFQELAGQRRSADVVEPAAKAERAGQRVAAATDQVIPNPPLPASAFEEIAVTAARATQAQRSAPPAAAPLQDAAGIAGNTSSPQLLRQYFPQAYAGDAPRTLWLVQDAAGNTLSSGELPAGQDFAAINPNIEAQFSGQRLGPWVIEEVRGARGQPIKLGIARLQYNPGQ
jgi:hypothetical protein